jgi:hypothetical protein
MIALEVYTHVAQTNEPVTVCVLVIVAAPALGLLWLAPGREIVPGEITRPCGPCVVDWHSKRGVLVLACPRHDLIKL